MKFGVHAGLWMAKWTDEIKPILKIVSDIGFDGVEISLLGMDQYKAKSLNKVIKDFKLEVGSGSVVVSYDTDKNDDGRYIVSLNSPQGSTSFRSRTINSAITSLDGKWGDILQG